MIIDGTEYNRQIKKKKPNENTLFDYVKSMKEQIDKENLELRIESLIQSNILEFVKEKMADLFVDIEQQNAVLANPATPDPKYIRM